MTSIKFSSKSLLGTTGTQKYEQAKSLSSPAATKEDTPSSIPQSTTVSISGRAMLLSRLFHTENPQADPKIETSTTTANQSGSVYSFLTSQDRDVVSKLYDYARSNGVDPVKVDNIAFDLGVYRMAGPAGPMETAGYLFDLQGNPIISEFNPKDETVAQKVLNSKAMGDTLIDNGFLKAVFTPGKTPVHASDFSFLEQAVFAFSASGSDGASDPNAAPVIRPKKEDYKPLNLDSQALQSGSEAMLSRLFGTVSVDSTTPATALDSFKRTSNFADFLNDSDREMLGRLYAVAQSRNENLSKIDHLAIVIGNSRMTDKFNSMLLDGMR